jgi:hypothetical protein
LPRILDDEHQLMAKAHMAFQPGELIKGKEYEEYVNGNIQ